jgi:hypothetical protein
MYGRGRADELGIDDRLLIGYNGRWFVNASTAGIGQMTDDGVMRTATARFYSLMS